MEHNIIHHTESVPVREPLTVEQADKLIEQYGDTLDAELMDWQKTILRRVLTHNGTHFTVNGPRRANQDVLVHALDRIEEARAHGLA